jgi:HAD superfamily hydrolase (TIGR01549 family)
MKYSQAKAVFFDLGYTLIEYGDHDWRRSDLEGHRKGYDCLVDRGCHLPNFELFNKRLLQLKDECRPADRGALREWRATDAPEVLLNELKVDNPMEMSRLLIEVVYADAQNYMTVANGGLETLRQLKILGYQTGIISNTLYPRELLNADLERLGLKPYLDVTIYSSEIGYRKPHPEIYQAASVRSNLQPEQIIYVGDRYRIDVLGAKTARLLPVLKYREGMDYPDPLPDDIPVIYHIPEIVNILKAKPISYKA